MERPTSEKDLNLKQSEVTSPSVVAEPAATPTLQAPVAVAQASSSMQQAPPANKPLLWSAASVASESAESTAGEDQSNVPPMLRGLKKCEACGFPISGGRVLCVECEEKKWRGQLRKPAGAPMPTGALPAQVRKPEGQALAAVAGSAAGVSTSAVSASVTDLPVKAAVEFIKSPQDVSPATVIKTPAQPAKVSSETPIFSAGLAPSQSWLARNKYVLGVLLVVAAGIAGVIFLR